MPKEEDKPIKIDITLRNKKEFITLTNALIFHMKSIKGSFEGYGRCVRILDLLEKFRPVEESEVRNDEESEV